MPVLINRETGLAENLTPQQEQQAMVNGTHDVPLYTPEGQPYSAPHADVGQLLQSGFTLPKPEEYKHMLNYAKASEQPIRAGLEGAASAATLGLSRAIGDKEMQALRKEANPIASVTGELAGLGASALAGYGAAPIMESAGLLGAATLGLGEASTAARVGTTAAKLGIENAVFQAGSEVDKMLLKDPEQSVSTAILNTGAAALLGAGIGGAAKGANELWSATAGKKMTSLLDAYKNKVNGLPVEMANTAGIELAPEMAAVLGETPEAHRAFQTLMESNTPSGQKMQKLYQEFKEASDVAIKDTVGGPVNMDVETLGEKLKTELANQIRTLAEPSNKKYQQIKDAFSNVLLDVEDKADIGERLTNLAVEQGWPKMPSGPGNNMFNKTLEHLHLQETAADIDKYAKGLKKAHQYNTEGFYPANEIAKRLEAAIDTAIEKNIGFKAPEIMAEYQATKAEYGKFKNVLEELNKRIHVGKASGEKSFLANLKDAQAEDIVKRLSPKGDAAFARILDTTFPEVGALVKQIELNKLVNKARDGELISAKKLFKQIEGLKSENQAYLDYILPKDKADRLEAIHALLDKVPSKMNTSGTAKTLDSLWAAGPAGVGAAIGSLFGGPVGGILGAIGAHYGKQVPDAIRISLLKFLGSELPTSAIGMKKAISYAENVVKGEALLNKAVKSVYEGGAKVIPFPETKHVEKMQQFVASNDMKEDELGHYMPEHATSVAMHTIQVRQYLKNMEPNVTPLSPLDKPRVPNAMEKARYKEAVQIAEQPGIILNYIKDGTLTAQQIHHMQAMYPQLTIQMQQKLLEGLVAHKAKNGMLPYKVQMSLSAFIGQPLTSSLTPNAIMANQIQPQQTQQQTAPISKTSKLSRQPANYATPLQRQEMGKH
jgi:truncated hemoglobin YjbI